MTPLERKVDLLLGLVQDLRERLDTAPGLAKSPTSEWISALELAEHVGVTPTAIRSWVRAGRFPGRIVRKHQRGKSIRYSFLAKQSIEHGRELRFHGD